MAVFYDQEVIRRYEKASNNVKLVAYETILNTVEVLGNAHMYVSSLIRYEGSHVGGRSIDITWLAPDNYWFHIYKDQQTKMFLFSSQILEKVYLRMRQRIISQFICPFYIIDSSVPNGYSTDVNGQKGNLITQHWNHIHITYV